MKKLFVSDYTLRKLAQDGVRDLLFREKTAIAACIDGIGADQLELPAVTKPREDRVVYKTIASMVKIPVAVPVGYDEVGVEQAWDCIRTAEKPVLQVMLPVAAAQMEYGFRAKEGNMLERIAALTAMAKERCEAVEFSAQDATRADPEFVCKACLTAQEKGATCITVCDDTGTCLPEEIAALVKKVKQTVSVPVLVSLADSVGLAGACAYAAAAAGADGIKTAMTGADVLQTELFTALIVSRGEQIGVCTGIRSTGLHRDILQALPQLQRQTAAAGSELSAADVFLDADSSLTDVCEATGALGYTLSDEDNGLVYRMVQQVCQKKSSLGARELEALIASYAMQAPSTYHLGSFQISCGSVGTAMAQVTLVRDGENLLGVATGDGPIDAAFRAIEQCIGYHYELDEFQIQAVTEGKEALGSTLVRLRNNGRLYVGNGLSADIVGSSIRAYINALNKIVFEEQ